MKPRGYEAGRRSGNSHEGVPSWIIMAGGVLLSALSARLGYKVKQAVHSKSLENGTQNSNGMLCMLNQDSGGMLYSIAVIQILLKCRWKI